jgi:dipeptidyl aminopeptidase/acylaminoacyl peptidase
MGAGSMGAFGWPGAFGTWWQADGKHLIVGGNDGLGVGLWSLGLDGTAEKLATGAVMPANGFWIDGDVSRTGAIAFVGQSATSPGELYVMDSKRAAPRKLTDVNGWVAQARLGRMEAVHGKGPQGTMIDGALTLPPDAAPGRKYPLALVIHGGPAASSRLRFTVSIQSLAARGFIVFEPNYRGSDNLGNAFKSAIYGDAGEGPGQDIMAGLETVMARPDVAPGKPLVSGWSYGGFMTTWLLGRYPDAWKAAVSGAPVTNWQHQFDLSDGNVAQSERLGASPYKDGGAEILWKQSPASMQTKIKVPTLVMSDTEDFRVPFTQAYSLYRSLEERGVETKFFVFPIRGHSPADPIRQGDMWQVWIDWLAAHKD